jgi:hypothetical protein
MSQACSCCCLMQQQLCEDTFWHVQMHQALLALKSAEAAVSGLPEKVAALDAILNLHRPPGCDASDGSIAMPLRMLHEIFRFKLSSAVDIASNAGLQLQRLLPALDAILGAVSELISIWKCWKPACVASCCSAASHV